MSAVRESGRAVRTDHGLVPCSYDGIDRTLVALGVPRRSSQVMLDGLPDLEEFIRHCPPNVARVEDDILAIG